MENWDLQAIVRGYTIMEKNNNYNYDTQSWSFETFGVDNYNYGFFEKKTSVFDELEELYKPFYSQPNMDHIISSTNHHPFTQVTPHEPVLAVTDSVSVVIPKRRKNQQKREVKHVAADDLSSDTWAWRKYGQKPIKGSPYPRSYYRCSSSKGCLARKQVERDNTDPTMFIISYTAEHNHTHPVRRNSLSGLAKKKASTIIKNDPNNNIHKDITCFSPISSSSTTHVLSPTSPLMPCLEDSFMSSFEGLDGLTTDMSALQCWFSEQIPAKSMQMSLDM